MHGIAILSRFDERNDLRAEKKNEIAPVVFFLYQETGEKIVSTLQRHVISVFDNTVLGGREK